MNTQHGHTFRESWSHHGDAGVGGRGDKIAHDVDSGEGCDCGDVGCDAGGCGDHG